MIGLFIVTFLDLLVSFAVIIEQLLNNNKPAGKNNTRILLLRDVYERPMFVIRLNVI